MIKYNNLRQGYNEEFYKSCERYNIIVAANNFARIIQGIIIKICNISYQKTRIAG